MTALSSLAIEAPSLAFQYYQIIFAVILAIILVSIGLLVKRDEDHLTLTVSLVSAFSLIASTIMISIAQSNIKSIHWYEVQFPEHYKINYYALVALLFILLIGGFILTFYILYKVRDDSKKKKMTSILMTAILFVAIIASVSSSASVPEKETTYQYELSLGNLSEETSYVLYVPTIYNTRKKKMDAVFKDEDMQGEATIDHIDSSRGILLKINGTGPLELSFHYRGSEEDYELILNDEIIEDEPAYEQENFLLYYNSTSDQKPIIDLRYECSVPIRNTEFQMNGNLNEKGWQSVQGSYERSVS